MSIGLTVEQHPNEIDAFVAAIVGDEVLRQDVVACRLAGHGCARSRGRRGLGKDLQALIIGHVEVCPCCSFAKAELRVSQKDK